MKQKEFYTTPQSEDILIVPNQLVCVSLRNMGESSLFDEEDEEEEE